MRIIDVKSIARAFTAESGFRLKWFCFAPIVVAVVVIIIHAVCFSHQPANERGPSSHSLGDNIIAPSSKTDPEITITSENDMRSVDAWIGELANQPGMDSYLSRGRSVDAIEADIDRLGPRAVAPLIQLLTDARLPIRYCAIMELGRMRVRAAVGPLMSLLASKSSEGTQVDRTAAIIALGKIGDPASIETLIKELDGSNNDNRAAAVTALAEVAGIAESDRFRRMLLEDNSVEVRLACAQVCVKLHDVRMIPQLITSLSDDSMVADQSAIALAELGRSDGMSQLLHRLHVLEGAPGSEGRGQRIEIIRLLGKLHDPRAISILDELASNDFDPKVKQEAKKAVSLIER